jgi:multiple sugar transport system substrate-binding protein
MEIPMPTPTARRSRSRARRTLVVTLASLLAAGGLAACGEDDTDPGASGGAENATLRLQVSGEPEETAVYAAIASAYENANPGRSVEVVQVPSKGDHLARLSTSFAAGNPPDVFLVNFREYSQFVARGAITPVGPMLEERGVDTADYFAQPVEAFTYDDALQCMPQNISSLVVYYNTALFEAAGVEEPADGWTWDAFVSAGKTLTGGDVRGIGIDPNIIRIAPFVWSDGGDIVDDLKAPTRFTLSDPAARGALEDVLGLVQDGLVPTQEEVAAQDLQTRFITGKLGMLLSSRREVPALREVQGLAWDVAPLPVRGEPATILHSDAYCLSSKGTAHEAAADFVAFATGKQGQTIAALGGRTVPSLKSVADSPAFLDPSKDPSRSQVFLDGIGSIRRTPVIPTWPEIEDVTEEELGRAFYDGVDLDTMLAGLDERTRELFARGTSSAPR